MALVYLLYKLAFRNEEVTTPEDKIEPPPAPSVQKNRKNQNVNIIPDAKSSINADARDVYLVSRVVQGDRLGNFVGLIEKYYGSVVKAIWTAGLSVALDDAPDPTHHWAVVTGDYLHQLDAYPNWNNYYLNERFSESAGWTKYKIGVTNFNDIAVRNAGTASDCQPSNFPHSSILPTSRFTDTQATTIASQAMNEMPEEYNILDNNCQHFALRLLDKILRDGRRKLKTLNHHYISAQDFTTTPVSTDGVVSVQDKDDEVAIIENEAAHKNALEDAITLMVNKTPLIKDADLPLRASDGMEQTRK